MRTPYLLLLWPPFSNEMAPDLVNGVNGRALVTKLASTNGKASRQSNRAQTVRLFHEPAPSSFRLSYDVHHRILFGWLTKFLPSSICQIRIYIYRYQTYLEGALSAESFIF